MRRQGYKSSLAIWLPLGLKRLDLYFAWFYCKTFVLILVGLIVLVSIGDLFQRFDELADLARQDGLELGGTIGLFIGFYSVFVPQIVFQFMLPTVMLLAAAITITASYCGPRGNNEYTVIRASGVPVLRAFLPLLLPALLLGAAFQYTRDHFLPDMVRGYQTLNNRLRSRLGLPTSLSLMDRDSFQTATIGNFDADGVAHNLLLEFRDAAAFRRGDAGRGDNDFVAHRAAAAVLEKNPSGGYQWTPLSKGEIHTYTRFIRQSRPWTRPVPTGMTRAMIERQILSDAVCSWSDLLTLRRDNPGADFEFHWRLAEPVSCFLLVLWGAALWMGRMLRFTAAGYIPAVGVSMLAAVLFYVLRVTGRTLWENGVLNPEQGVWLPLAAAGAVAALTAWRMEP
ncbi:MAG: LptF/LptG family permease [Planctomycetota bacterium]|jgi:lipopolysaccharide export LptBFGC system permease protein LptF|nr:LptF/LptG family permease [Planctomycetota bacterium]